MKKLWVSGMLLSWVIVSSALPAWAQNAPAAQPVTTPSTQTPATNNASNQNNPNNLEAIGRTFTNAAAPPPQTPTAANNAANVTNNNAVGLPPLPPVTNNNGAIPDATAPGSNNSAALLNQNLQAQAFDNALNTQFPLTPDQIRQIMERMNEVQIAGRAPPDPDPKATVKIEDIPLDPGVQPPVIKVAQGYVTTVNILDVTGQPWPIQDVVVGGNFQVTGPNDAQVLRIIPQTRFGRGNLSVRLVGLATPITFRVESGGAEVYYRYDARITQAGPGAKQPLIDHGFSGQAGDSTLMSVLSGVPTQNAKRLTLTGADGRTQAWEINGQFYIRTPLTLLSPGWDSSVRSADGTSVYVLAETPVLMFSDNGQMVRSHVDIPPEDPFHPSDLQEGKITVPVTPAAATGVLPSQISSAQTALQNTAPVQAVMPATSPSSLPGGAAAQSATTPATQTTAPTLLPRTGGVQIYTGGTAPQTTGPQYNLKIGGN